MPQEKLKKDDPLRKALIGLICSIAQEVQMKEENQVLILYHLNTEGRVIMFNEWVKSKLMDGKLMATEAEVCRAAVQIHKETE